MTSKNNPETGSFIADNLRQGVETIMMGSIIADRDHDRVIRGTEVQQLAPIMGQALTLLPGGMDTIAQSACQTYAGASPAERGQIDANINQAITEGLQFLHNPPSEQTIALQSQLAQNRARSIAPSERNTQEQILATEGPIIDHLAKRFGEALNDPRLEPLRDLVPDRAEGITAGDLCSGLPAPSTPRVPLTPQHRSAPER